MEKETQVYHWKRFDLIERDMVLPNDKKITHTLVKHPGASVIIPIDAKGNLVMLKQFRPAINSWIIEFAAGTIEEGEDHQACAIRELAEECGLAAKKWQYIGDTIVTPGFCDERLHCYLCSDLMPAVGEMDEDEVIETFAMSPQEFEQAVVSQEIIDSKTITSYFKAKLALDTQRE